MFTGKKICLMSHIKYVVSIHIEWPLRWNLVVLSYMLQEQYEKHQAGDKSTILRQEKPSGQGRHCVWVSMDRRCRDVVSCNHRNKPCVDSGDSRCCQKQVGTCRRHHQSHRHRRQGESTIRMRALWPPLPDSPVPGLCSGKVDPLVGGVSSLSPSSPGGGDLTSCPLLSSGLSQPFATVLSLSNFSSLFHHLRN